jgi:hypothetical protein
MTLAVPARFPILGDRPFVETGVSLYVTLGDAVRYRRARVGSRRSPICGGDRSNYDHWPKTLRREFVSSPDDSISFSLPETLIEATVIVDVRRCESGIENDSTGFRTLSLTIDDDGHGVPNISGSATALAPVVLAGGIVRLRFVWVAGLGGVVPTQFRAVRTAGPTSPADVVQPYAGGTLVEIETIALLDSAPYEFQIVAENAGVSAIVLAGYAVQADASGPPAVSVVTSRDW